MQDNDIKEKNVNEQNEVKKIIEEATKRIYKEKGEELKDLQAILSECKDTMYRPFKKIMFYPQEVNIVDGQQLGDVLILRYKPLHVFPAIYGFSYLKIDLLKPKEMSFEHVWKLSEVGPENRLYKTFEECLSTCDKLDG